MYPFLLIKKSIFLFNENWFLILIRKAGFFLSYPLQFLYTSLNKLGVIKQNTVNLYLELQYFKVIFKK